MCWHDVSQGMFENTLQASHGRHFCMFVTCPLHIHEEKNIEAAPYIYIRERYLNAILPSKNYAQEPVTRGAGNRKEEPPFPTSLPPICPQ